MSSLATPPPPNLQLTNYGNRCNCTVALHQISIDLFQSQSFHELLEYYPIPKIALLMQSQQIIQTI